MNEDLARPIAGNSPEPSARSPLVDAFVGRKSEMAALRAGLDSTLAGRGRLFLISGEPGIGKSRLAEELSREARARGVSAVWGRCWEGSGAPAYWPIIQILRGCAELPDFAPLVESLGKRIAPLTALVPEALRLPPSPEEHASSDQTDPEQGRFRLFDAVATLLRGLARREPMLVVVDDLHDADASTLETLRFVARELRSVPLLLIGTHREAEVERSPELQTAIADLAREGSQLPLSGLTQSDIANYVSARAGAGPDDRFVTLLHQTTNGNPLFLQGVARILAGTAKFDSQERVTVADLKLPANVRGAIKARVAGLSAQTEALLSAAAVVGNEFGLELLQRVSEGPGRDVAERLDEAMKAGVIERVADSPGRYRFAHALIRGVIYNAIGTVEQHRLHRRIAEEIEKIYADNIESHLQELAYHYTGASPSGTAEKAIEYAIRAGRAAYAVFGYAKARENWKAALTLLDRADSVASARRAWVLSRLGDELITPGPKAVEYLEASLRECQRLDDRRLALGLHIRLGSYYSRPNMVMDVPRALAHLREAEALATRETAGVALASIFDTRAGVFVWSDAVDEGIAAARKAIEVAERAGAQLVCVQATLNLGRFLVQRGCVRQGLEMIELARMKTDPLEDRLVGSIVAYWGADIRRLLGDPAEAAAWLTRELTRPRTAQSPFRCAVLHKLTSRVCFDRGDLTAAREHDENSAILVSPTGTWIPDLYRLFFEGDWDAARMIATASIDQWVAMGCVLYAIESGLLLARLFRTQGAYDQAKISVDQGLRRAREGGDVANELRAAAEAVLIFAAAGPIEPAISHLERCREILAGGEDWRGLAGDVARAEAVVAAAEHRVGDAITAFERAAAIYQRYSLPWEEAEVLFLWGGALRDPGETTNADCKFDSALEIYRRVGAGQAWIDRTLTEKAHAVRATKSALDPSAENECVLRPEGEYWTIAYEGTTSRLKDAKGLQYISYLLAHPGEEIRASDLAALIGGAAADEADMAAAHDFANSATLTGDLGDAGEMLDAQAKAEYRRRLKELRKELEEAREFRNTERAEQAQAEIDALAHELKGAIGLGGRRRRAASSSERARTAITRAIRLALGKIAENNPALGKLLSTTIRTGTSCSYFPDERFPVSWKF